MPEVPFADARRRIAFGLEGASDGDFFGGQAAGGIAKNDAPFFAAGHAAADRQAAREQRRATGSADAGGDVEIREPQTLGGHPVQVRSANGGMSVTTQISVTEIVGQDNDDIGWTSGETDCRRESEAQKKDEPQGNAASR